MNHDSQPATPAPIWPNSGSLATPRRVDIRDLLGNSRELRIQHGSQEYRLTLTSKGKLILTK